MAARDNLRAGLASLHHDYNEPETCLFLGAWEAQRRPTGSFLRERPERGDVVPSMIGKKVWAIAEGYIPEGGSEEGDQALVSHETAYILNPGDENAAIEITVFFKDREPAGPYLATVAARRTLHLRFNDLNDPEPIPKNTDYASIIRSDRPIVVQHTRLDSRGGAIALLSTTAYAQ